MAGNPMTTMDAYNPTEAMEYDRMARQDDARGPVPCRVCGNDPCTCGHHEEPMCCGEPMVHNTWAGQWECADAYFRLFDEGWDGGDPRDPDDLDVEVPVKAGILDLVTADELRGEGADHLVPFLDHWRKSWRPDDAEVERRQRLADEQREAGQYLARGGDRL